MIKKFVTLVVAANIVAAPALATPTMADLQAKGKELLDYASDKKFMTGAATSAVVILAALWIGRKYGCPASCGKKGASSASSQSASAGASSAAAGSAKRGPRTSSPAAASSSSRNASRAHKVCSNNHKNILSANTCVKCKEAI